MLLGEPVKYSRGPITQRSVIAGRVEQTAHKYKHDQDGKTERQGAHEPAYKLVVAQTQIRSPDTDVPGNRFRRFSKPTGSKNSCPEIEAFGQQKYGYSQAKENHVTGTVK